MTSFRRMRRIQIENIDFEIYRDAEEFTKEFFDIPEGAVLDKTDLPETAGFACPETGLVSLFIGDCKSFEELLSTVAHELGHLQHDSLFYDSGDEGQENKANHFESFVMLSYNIAKRIYNEELSNV